MKNPWEEYFERSSSNKFHPRDESHALAFNIAMKTRKNFKLADHLEPFPFLGNPSAPVVVLLANPGKSRAEENKSFSYSPKKLELHQKNILHQDFSDFSSRLDSPNDRSLESPYFKQRTAQLVNITSVDKVARNVFFVNFHGYHSKSWYPIPFTFYTQLYSFYLVKRAISEGAQIIMSRNKTGWMTAVPELTNYPDIATFISPRSVHLSNKNLGIKVFEKIVKLIG